MNVITTASHQWATRPDDQRFISLADLEAAVSKRKDESFTVVAKPKAIRISIGDVNGNAGTMAVEMYDQSIGQMRQLEPTHWAFGQLCTMSQSPASYLRRLDPMLAAVNLQWSLDNLSKWDETLVLGQSNGLNVMRATTSIRYGRIWDKQIVNLCQRIAGPGSGWKIPAASYSATNPKRATTLYASDHDVFVFLVNEDKPIEVDGTTLYRGFMTYNSEVGDTSWYLGTFLYNFVCDNRCIWGARDLKELRVRHTGGAPERFAYEGEGMLKQYVNSSGQDIVNAVRAAKQYELPPSEKKDGGWTNWLQKRGFAKSMAEAAVTKAHEEEGQSKSLWDIVQGITASARSISHTDVRVEMERRAGALLNIVSN